MKIGDRVLVINHGSFHHREGKIVAETIVNFVVLLDEQGGVVWDAQCFWPEDLCHAEEAKRP